MNIKSLRNQMFAWAKQNLAGKKVINEETQLEIQITASGLKHTLKGKNLNNPAELQKNLDLIESVKDLEELLEKAYYQGAENDSKGRSEIKAIHIFENEWDSKLSDYEVKLIVRENLQGNYFYDHSLKEKTQTPSGT